MMPEEDGAQPASPTPPPPAPPPHPVAATANKFFAFVETKIAAMRSDARVTTAPSADVLAAAAPVVTQFVSGVHLLTLPPAGPRPLADLNMLATIHRTAIDLACGGPEAPKTVMVLARDAVALFPRTGPQPHPLVPPGAEQELADAVADAAAEKDQVPDDDDGSSSSVVRYEDFPEGLPPRKCCSPSSGQEASSTHTHPPPPALGALVLMCDEIATVCAAGGKAVIAGRAGDAAFLACAYLMRAGTVSTAAEAIARLDGHGASTPSRVRYLKYFEELLQGGGGGGDEASESARARFPTCEWSARNRETLAAANGRLPTPPCRTSLVGLQVFSPPVKRTPANPVVGAIGEIFGRTGVGVQLPATLDANRYGVAYTLSCGGREMLSATSYNGRRAGVLEGRIYAGGELEPAVHLPVPGFNCVDDVQVTVSHRDLWGNLEPLFTLCFHTSFIAKEYQGGAGRFEVRFSRADLDLRTPEGWHTTDGHPDFAVPEGIVVMAQFQKPDDAV